MANDDRATRARRALDVHSQLTGQNPSNELEDCMIDILTDLRHLADKSGEEWDVVYGQAMRHYAYEALDLAR